MPCRPRYSPAHLNLVTPRGMSLAEHGLECGCPFLIEQSSFNLTKACGQDLSVVQTKWLKPVVIPESSCKDVKHCQCSSTASM
jgi:hypothetical protein